MVKHLFVLTFVGVCGLATAKLELRSIDNDRFLTINGIQLEVPPTWSVHQKAQADGTVIVGLQSQAGYFRLYAREVNRGQLLSRTNTFEETDSSEEAAAGLRWQVRHGIRQGQIPLYSASLEAHKDGIAYFGIAQSLIIGESYRLVETFLRHVSTVSSRSLTGAGFTGTKYYLGFGDNLSGFMGNEVLYDIKHTHDIFTGQFGGKYLGNKVHGTGMGAAHLRNQWNFLRNQMTAQDMYVQYSSGHGSSSGLMFGVSYHEMRDFALSLPAKEVVIFTMACYSGNLVNSFNQKKHEWQDYTNNGRTLFVMASSSPHQTSSTGPGTDKDEPGGPYGSAGSAFGHALWKALIGYADGHVDGIRDGFLSLQEIQSYTVWKTQQVGGHTPVFTGSYVGALVMNQVPPKEFIRALELSSEGLSEEQVMQRIQQLDAAFRAEQL